MAPGNARYDAAVRIALEHAWWCEERGMRPADVLRSLDPDWRLPANPTWHHVVWALAGLWHEIAEAPSTIPVDRQLKLTLAA